MAGCSNLRPISGHSSSDDRVVVEAVPPRQVAQVVVVGSDVQWESVERDRDDVVARSRQNGCDHDQ